MTRPMAFARRQEHAYECCGTTFNSREGWLEHQRNQHGGLPKTGRRHRR
ncbi:MAG: hypothetical protein HYT80_07540 [Euryarchaeota archaeon]|nr:hypothetical protein [Euryarchaeota archaeon]